MTLSAQTTRQLAEAWNAITRTAIAIPCATGPLAAFLATRGLDLRRITRR